AHGADELAAEVICGKGLIEQLLSLRHVQTSHSLSGYSPLAVFSAMAATTQGLSSLYVTPYHLSALRRTFTRALPSSSSWVTTLGRKYSPFRGLVFIVVSRNFGKRASASFRKLSVKPQRFMETIVLPGTSVQVSPPSSVKRASSPIFSMWVRSVT